MAGKRHGSMPRGFTSKAQWKFFFANPKLRRFAKKEAHKVEARGGKVTGYRALPARKGVRRHI